MNLGRDCFIDFFLELSSRLFHSLELGFLSWTLVEIVPFLEIGFLPWTVVEIESFLEIRFLPGTLKKIVSFLEIGFFSWTLVEIDSFLEIAFFNELWWEMVLFLEIGFLSWTLVEIVLFLRDWIFLTLIEIVDSLGKLEVFLLPWLRLFKFSRILDVSTSTFFVGSQEKAQFLISFLKFNLRRECSESAFLIN